MPRAAFGALIALSMTNASAQTSTPIGMWQTIDDVSGEPKTIIQIADDGNGQLSGKIVRCIGRLDNPERTAARASARTRSSRA